MRKQYLKHGDRAFCTGCFLYYNGEKGEFELEAIEDDCFFDGEPVQFEVSKGTDKPYIEIEGD